jgi:hypothetical protein
VPSNEAKFDLCQCENIEVNGRKSDDEVDKRQMIPTTRDKQAKCDSHEIDTAS